MNRQFQSFNKLEANRFIHLQKQLSKVIQTQIGKKVKAKVRTGLNKVTKRLDSLLNSTQDNSNNVFDLKKYLKDVGVNAQREQGNENPKQLDGANVYEEQQSKNKTKDTAEYQVSATEKINTDGTLVIHASEEKTSNKETADDEPPTKRLKKGKGITTEEKPLKQLLPLLEKGGSDPKMLNLQQFSISGKKMTLEEAQEQLSAMKRLADLKAAEDKSKRSLEKINIQAQAEKKINYRIDKVTKDAIMRIERDNQPLSLTVMQKFRLKQLGFSEWIEIQDLASKGKSKANDILLRSLIAKFEWVKTQSGKLGLFHPPELTS
ncbi:hypothetical protein Tco_1073781 [Tanacetum coccineum]